MTDYGPRVEQWADRIERPNGMLTKKDRRWIYETKVGNDMYETKQGDHQRRVDAAVRIQNGLLDFSILMDAGNTQFSELMERSGIDDDIDPDLAKALEDCVAWIYETCRRSPDLDFEETVGSGVARAMNRFNLDTVELEDGAHVIRTIRTVDVDIDPQREDPKRVEAAIQKLREGRDLDDDEIGTLVRGRLGQEGLLEAIEEVDSDTEI